MSVQVTNRSGKGMDLREVKRLASRLLERMGQCGGMSIVILSDEEMGEYNRTFLHRNHPTDVLAFPDNPSCSDRESYLGDILISVDTAKRQAGEIGHSLSTEIKTLTIHGFLHLLGYDHTNDDGEMLRLEQSLRRNFIEGENRVARSAESLSLD